MSHEGERVNGFRMANKRERAPPHWLNPLVERSRYAAARAGLLRLRTLHTGGLVLHWSLTVPSAGCRRLAVHDARQTINNNR
jgi:hypothetical protein